MRFDQMYTDDSSVVWEHERRANPLTNNLKEFFRFRIHHAPILNLFLILPTYPRTVRFRFIIIFKGLVRLLWRRNAPLIIIAKEREDEGEGPRHSKPKLCFDFDETFSECKIRR